MQARTERGSLAEALAAASGELARYREVTGRSLDSLEAERSSAAALATRSKAQVGPSPAVSNHCLGLGAVHGMVVRLCRLRLPARFSFGDFA